MNTLGSAIIMGPAIVASYGRENSWISVLIASMIGILVVLMYIQIFKLDRNKDIFQLLEKLLGKWLGKFISFLFVLYVFYVVIGNLRAMGDFIITHILVETPLEVMILLILITCLIGVRMGIEVISRTSEVFFPYVAIAIFLLIAMVFKEAEVTKIQPILQTNIGGMLAGAVPLIGYPFFELIILLSLMKDVNKPEKAKKAFIIGVTIGGFLLTSITLMCLLVLGVDLTVRNTYPTYVLGKKISIADFVERVEVIVAIIWFFTIFFKIMTIFYVLSVGVSRILNLKSYKTVTVPIAYFIIVFAVVLAPNVVYTSQFITGTWIPLSATFGLVLPIILLVVGLLKENKTRS